MRQRSCRPECGTMASFRPWTCFGVAIFLLLACGWAVAAEILVLQSHDSPPYQQTLQGIKAVFDRHGLHVDFELITINVSTSDQILAERLRERPPQLLIALGTPATRAAVTLSRTIPIVSGLLLDSDELRGQPLLTGVELDFPPRLQWQWLRRLLPDAQRIAVLYDPKHGLALFQDLQQQAKLESIQLIPAPAQAPEDLPALLQQLPAQLDALWAVDGVAAFNAVAVRELLLYSFRNRTPLIGLSAQWVKAGAIYALDWDYADLGAQAAELALNILDKGMSPSSLPPQPPRRVRPVFNSRTAEHMKIAIPERWLPEIAEVLQ